MATPLAIGNQTAFSAGDALQPYRFAWDHGFTAFEWFSDKKGDRGWAFDDMGDAQREQLRHVVATGRMRFSVHAPWQANALDDAGRLLLHRALDFGQAIRAEVVVAHYYGHAGVDGFWQALRPAALHAAHVGLRLAIENTVESPPEELAQLCQRAGDDADPRLRQAVGLCLDLGHANLFGGTRHDVLGFVTRLGAAPIIHLHAHENWGDRDSHLTLFTGPFAHDDRGLRAVLRVLARQGYAGLAILEQWPQPTALLTQARDRLRSLWADCCGQTDVNIAGTGR